MFRGWLVRLMTGLRLPDRGSRVKVPRGTQALWATDLNHAPIPRSMLSLRPDNRRGLWVCASFNRLRMPTVAASGKSTREEVGSCLKTSSVMMSRH